MGNVLQLSTEDMLQLQATIKGHKLATDFKGTDFENIFRLWRFIREDFIDDYGLEVVEAHNSHIRLAFLRAWNRVEV